VAGLLCGSCTLLQAAAAAAEAADVYHSHNSIEAATTVAEFCSSIIILAPPWQHAVPCSSCAAMICDATCLFLPAAVVLQAAEAEIQAPTFSPVVPHADLSCNCLLQP
jgi:hypothetical protein